MLTGVLSVLTPELTFVESPTAADITAIRSPHWERWHWRHCDEPVGWPA